MGEGCGGGGVEGREGGRIGCGVEGGKEDRVWRERREGVWGLEGREGKMIGFRTKQLGTHVLHPMQMMGCIAKSGKDMEDIRDSEKKELGKKIMEF